MTLFFGKKKWLMVMPVMVWTSGLEADVIHSRTLPQ